MHRSLLPIGLVAVAVFAHSHAPSAEDASQAPSIVMPPTITPIGMSSELYGELQVTVLTLEVTNPNAASIVYTGYAPDSFDPPIPEGVISPFYQIATQQNGEWQTTPMGWCGTGMANLELKPNSTANFTVGVPGGEWDAVKVEFGHDPGWSLEETTTTTTRWSITVPREEIESPQ